MGLLLKFQFLRFRADFGVCFTLEAYLRIVNLYLVAKKAGKFIRERRNQNSKSATISRRRIMTLHSTGFLSCDLTALGFSVVAFLH